MYLITHTHTHTHTPDHLKRINAVVPESQVETFTLYTPYDLRYDFFGRNITSGYRFHTCLGNINWHHRTSSSLCTRISVSSSSANDHFNFVFRCRYRLMALIIGMPMGQEVVPLSPMAIACIQHFD